MKGFEEFINLHSSILHSSLFTLAGRRSEVAGSDDIIELSPNLKRETNEEHVECRQ